MIASDLRVSVLSDGDATFAAEINARHRNLLACGKTALEEAIRIGELLVANKAAVRHGDWIRWIEKNLEFDRTAAFRYMRIFERRDELKCFSVQHLTDAYALLAKKIDHEPARAESEQPAAVATDSESKPDGAVQKPACERKIDKRSKQKPKSADDQIPTKPENSAEVRWRRALLDRAQSAEAYAAFGDWSQFKVDSELVNAATLAADAWTKLADYLRSRRLTLSPDDEPPF
jgi:Protein of unknown function (DUF3102)